MSTTKKEPYSKAKAHAEIIAEARKDRDGPRKEAMFKLPAALKEMILPYLEDERDMLIVTLMFNIMVTVWPAALCLFLFTSSHLYGLIYLSLTYFFFTQRFILMLHFSEHRKVFKPQYKLLNMIPSYFIAPFFGVPAGVYSMHHVIMHHVENNLFPWDISSTEPYDRRTIKGYLNYLLYWTVSIWFLLPAYLFKRKKYSFFKKTMQNITVFFLTVTLFYMINPVATMWVFIIPIGVSLILMSFGNYSQHIFIDPENPKSNFGLTYNCVNCLDNQYTFNDGYHIIHHQHSRLHWSELPDKFCEDLEAYNENNALIFRGVGFFEIGIMVVTGQFEKLASHYVQLGDKEKSTEEIVAIFKHRLQPIYHEKVETA